MTQARQLGGMLRNAETWTHITEHEITKLTMPVTMIHRTLLSLSGNSSRVLMCLELGVIVLNMPWWENA